MSLSRNRVLLCFWLMPDSHPVMIGTEEEIDEELLSWIIQERGNEVNAVTI